MTQQVPGPDASDAEQEQFRLAQQGAVPKKSTGLTGKGIAGLVAVAAVAYIGVKLFGGSTPDYTVISHDMGGSHNQRYVVEVSKYSAGDAKDIADDLYKKHGETLVLVQCKTSGSQAGLAWSSGVDHNESDGPASCP